MAVPQSLPQRVFVLAYNPAKGRLGLDTHLGAMLRAAALADLHRGGLIADERGRVVVGARRPCPDPVLVAVLEEIAGSKPRAWQSWVYHGQRAARAAVRRQLGDDGWARLEPRRILGLFPTVRVTLRDPRVRKELLGRVDAALKKPIGRVDPADAALAAIVAAGDLTLVLDRGTRRVHKRRIQELTALSGPAVPALRAAVEAAAVG
ncbi:hypothetical protein Val02_71040 [Virgisporangium aliadipatigenens]|uniref:GPP34 family phosphoprotein n=1 Tax=Virgisporangium aliadipatigenens TaxID=741659 RepID=A0A8J4DUM5_9ACTN|nr:GPP34 family phosphoprotein [Virgisporangium aliadipatigenens]GIJ50218.1 hypothetical protein Val02_71040 [Virgisporangium aliadipatigenens]